MNFREKLKNLTPEQCVKIAQIGAGDMNWKFIKSAYPWDGHDLIPVDKEEGKPSFLFQIDYRENVHSSLFRFYDKMGNESNSENIFEIIDYINSI